MFKIIKLTWPYPDQNILRQTPNHSGQWGDYKFYINDDSVTECDYWVVFNFALKKEKVVCPPENTLFIAPEPHVIQHYAKKFLEQFATVITCQREIEHPNAIYTLQAQPWWVGKSYDEMIHQEYIKKTKLLSIIASNKAYVSGHEKRLDFALRLKEHFKDEVDLYGRGINDFEDKWDVLAPYKYSIAIENSCYEDYLTEKLFDCYLAHTFPLYYGCPNAEKYFDSKSFVKIDIENFDASVNTIENILNSNNFYEDHLNRLKKEKNKYLNHYNLFPFVVNIIESKLSRPKKGKVATIIKPEKVHHRLILKSRLYIALRSILPTQIFELLRAKYNALRN